MSLRPAAKGGVLTERHNNRSCKHDKTRPDRRKNESCRLPRETLEEFLNGLRRMKQCGIPVMIGGKEKPEDSWDAIFKAAESRGEFYMADYIAAPYGEIKEIRLDKIRIHDLK